MYYYRPLCVYLGSALSNAETREPSLASSSGVRGSSQDMASRIHEICNLGKKVALHTQGNPTRSLSEPLGTMIMGETSPGGPKVRYPLIFLK